MPTRLAITRHSRARVVVACVLFAYLAIIRTRHISETFELLGDQILYWNIALRPWRDLPIGGGPSSVGGTTLGPAFLWTMWAIRHVVGPWTGNLPHAGGIGLSIIQSAADVLLLLGIWKRFSSPMLALAVTLMLATAPQEMSLSASIWNPPLAVAFIKMATAFVLLDDRRTLGWSAAATAASVLALQCHSSAVFFAVPVIVSLTIREWVAGGRPRAAQTALVSAAVVLLLEAPYLIDLAMHSGRQTSPARVVANVAFTLGHPAALRPRAAYDALAAAAGGLLVRPWTFALLPLLIAACAIVTAVRTRDDPALACVTFVPLLAAVAGFAFWQGAYEPYWFMTVMPSLMLTIALALTAWRPAAPAVSAALLVLVLVAQPARYADAQIINRLPTYGALARGSQAIRRHTSEVRRIDLEFPVEPSTSAQFIYERVLGGRISPSAPFAATIEPSGHVRFTQAGAASAAGPG
jgi:hypothetical protein